MLSPFKVVRRLAVLVMLSIFLIGGVLSTADAEARSIKHRSWTGYTVCYSKKWKRAHPHRHRCHRKHSRQWKVRTKAVRYALRQRGKPYVWGATGPWGFDCSGLIYAAYRHAGKYIPRTTYGQLAGLSYHGGRLRKGDLLFMHRGHVAMYIGHGRVVVARHTGTRITTQPSYMHNNMRRSPRF